MTIQHMTDLLQDAAIIALSAACIFNAFAIRALTRRRNA